MAERTGHITNIVGGLITIGIGLGAIYLNGWDFVATDWAFGNGAQNGFWIGQSNGVPVFLIEINAEWYGFARVHPDWAIVDSKVLNGLGLLFGLGMLVISLGVFFGLYDSDASTRNPVEQDPEPTKALREYLHPTDHLAPIFSNTQAETIISGGKQLTQAPVTALMEVDGQYYINEPCNLAIDENENLFLVSSKYTVEFRKEGDLWQGWYDDISRSDLPANPIEGLVRVGNTWKNNSISLSIMNASDGAGYVQSDGRAKGRSPWHRLPAISVVFILLIAIGVGVWLGNDILPAKTAIPIYEEALPVLKEGERYAVTRERLIEAGLKPAFFPRGGEYDPCHYQAICGAYPEVMDCSGTGLNPCRVAFIAPDQSVVVGQTGGETAADMTLDALTRANAYDTKVVQNALAGRAMYEGLDEEF